MKPQKSLYQQQSWSTPQSVIGIAIIILIAGLADSIFNLF